MQYPSVVSGVTNSDFLRSAINARQEKPISLFKFIKEMDKAIEQLQMKPDLAHRFLMMVSVVVKRNVMKSFR